MDWISVKDRMPEPDENVFIYATKWEAKGYDPCISHGISQYIIR